MASLLDIIKKGSTDRGVTIRIIDSTDGTPETGVVYTTSGIAMWYRRQGGALVAITEATLAAVDSAHSDGGIIHISDGEYRLDLPDAAFATGANYVDVGGTVTGMVVIGGRVRLVDVDLEDTVRAGLTALPNATPAGNGGLGTVDADNKIAGIVAAGITPIVTAAWATGAGAISWTHTVTDAATGLPLADVEVWVSTDSAGSNVVAGPLRTSAAGVVTFRLDAGAYYFWHQKSGWNFTDPDAETVS